MSNRLWAACVSTGVFGSRTIDGLLSGDIVEFVAGLVLCIVATCYAVHRDEQEFGA